MSIFSNELKRGVALRLAFCAALSLAMVPSAFALDDGGGTFAGSLKPEAPIVPGGRAPFVTEVVAGQNQMPILQTNSSELLQQAKEKYSEILAKGGFPSVAVAAMKKGDKGPNVAALNRRLNIEGYLQVEGTQGQFADMYTSATQDGVARFQKNHGLAPTGKVDASTVAELNVSAQQRLRTIDANIPRLEAYVQDLGNRYIIANIPAQQLEAVAGGRVYQRHNIIVGRPARPSPVVMTGLATVKFNPYWNAPTSIVVKDILPKVRANLQYLAQINMRIFEGGADGREVDPRTVDFNRINPQDYLFREDPGPANSMATAKIEFRSPFGIYLHDTPEKDKFTFDNRFFSSGCIRVQNMPMLVNWVLNGQDGYNEARIATMAKTLERLDVSLDGGPQLRVAYLTAWPAAGGTVAFRHDVYQMDGTGFTVGQPMPVGELSPEGRRFVLKPLPFAVPIDAAEAPSSDFFAQLFGRPSQRPSLAAVPAVPPPVATVQTTVIGGPPGKVKKGAAKVVAVKAAPPEQPLQVQPKGKSTSTFFDWPAYYKKQAAEAAKAAKVAKHPKKAKNSEDKPEETAKAKEKPVKAVKKVDCKADPKAKGCDKNA